jgi:GT2 family glycosyltransferase
MKSFPLISIITVNYNQTEVTCQMLESLRKVSYPNLEIFVVDNASRENPQPTLNALYPEANVIVSAENLGFAGGNNLAIREATGKYVLFLNNDTEVEPHFLEPLVALLEKDSTIGMVSPKIIFYGTDRLIQYAGSNPINRFTGRGVGIGSRQKDVGQFNDVRPTALIHGAAMMVPMEIIRRVALMPDLFFLYYEELDWCEMIKRAGYKIFYAGNSEIYHKESVSVGRNSPMKTFYMTRNRLVFMRRNIKGLEFWVSFLFFTFISIPKNVLVYLFRGEWQHLSSFVRGVAWNVTHHDIFTTPRLEEGILQKNEVSGQPALKS